MALGSREARAAAAVVLLAVMAACASPASNGAAPAEHPALATARALAAGDPSLARLLARSPDGFRAEGGALVSAGWGAAAADRFDGLRAPPPGRADAAVGDCGRPGQR